MPHALYRQQGKSGRLLFIRIRNAWSFSSVITIQGDFFAEPGATPERLKLAFGPLATLRGMPEIYSGDELAMQGGDDPDKRRDFPGGFPGQKDNGFIAAGRTNDEHAMFTWTSRLFQLRSQHSALQSGDLQDVFADDNALAFVRAADVTPGCSPGTSTDRVFVNLNKAAMTRNLSIPTAGTALDGCGSITPLYPVDSAPVTTDSGQLSISLPANAPGVYQAR